MVYIEQWRSETFKINVEAGKSLHYLESPDQNGHLVNP